MPQERSQQERSATLDLDHDSQSVVEFDQWARAVRQQMVAALKRRGNH